MSPSKYVRELNIDENRDRIDGKKKMRVSKSKSYD